jgi:PncC family amidohydrolase
MTTYNPATELLELLKERRLTVSTAESCTGGNIAHLITLIPGSSDVFMGGIVSYSNDVKHRVLGVGLDILEANGAVSEPVVEAMTTGACRACATDCAVATSGIAGPGGAVPGKPVGTVWIAARCHDRVVARKHLFPGNRAEVIAQASETALKMLIDLLNS